MKALNSFAALNRRQHCTMQRKSAKITNLPKIYKQNEILRNEKTTTITPLNQAPNNTNCRDPTKPPTSQQCYAASSYFLQTPCFPAEKTRVNFAVLGRQKLMESGCCYQSPPAAAPPRCAMALAILRRNAMQYAAARPSRRLPARGFSFRFVLLTERRVSDFGQNNI